MTETAQTAEEFWEGFYAERDQIWTGNTNKTLVREVTGMSPGTALDLGCGEGGDAIWLAAQGWRVTAVDVSVELARGGIAVEARVRTMGQTGVEMEALTAVAVAGLTVYDMLKAVDKAMVIERVRLVEKRGGRSGTFKARTVERKRR